MKRGRYLTQQKLSDHQFRIAIRCFAYGLAPSEAVRDNPVGRVRTTRTTIYQIYARLRNRLCEVGYFPDALHDISRFYAEEEDPQFEPYARRRTQALKAVLTVSRMRGLNDETRPHHLSEALHRFCNPDQTGEELFRDIERIIQISGKLDQTPLHSKRLEAYQDAMLYTRNMRRLRMIRPPRGHEEGHFELIRSYNEMIDSALRRAGIKLVSV